MIARVLDGHLPAGERDELRARRDVPVVQRGALERVGTNGHGVRTLARVVVQAWRNYPAQGVLAGLMRKDAAARLATVVAVAAMLVAAPARAGTYEVVSCNAPGAAGENHSWALEPYNSAGKTVPDASNFTVVGDDAVNCSPTVGIGFNPSFAHNALRVDDGAGWTFRAPAGTLVRRVTVWRHVAVRSSTDDPATPARAENGWWVATARAGTSAGGVVVIGAETCQGNAPRLLTRLTAPRAARPTRRTRRSRTTSGSPW